MNKVLLAAGILSASVAFSQNQTTRPSSTTTNTSNYSTTDTQNYNSQNATMGTNSSTNKPTSTTGNPNNRTGSSTMGTGTPSTNGSYNSNSGMSTSSGTNMGTGTSGTGTTTNGTYNNNGTGTSTTGSYNSNSNGTGTSTTTPSTNGTYNSNSGMGTGSAGSSTSSPSTGGSYNTNSMGTGTSTTTPSTTTDYNTNGSTNGGTTTTTTTSTYSNQPTSTAAPYGTKDYKNFAFGVYAGLNSTRYRGESVDLGNPEGRIGYQLGLFVRGGGRLYGQIGAEYFSSSAFYFRPGDGQSLASIRDQINVSYIQIPVYIGFKVTESDRGISAIRLQAGVEYANHIGENTRSFNFSEQEIKGGSFNGLGQLGFDIGAFLIDLTYHHGLTQSIQPTGFSGSYRRMVSASVGFKF